MRYFLKEQLFAELPPRITGHRTLLGARIAAFLAWLAGSEVIEIHDMGDDK